MEKKKKFRFLFFFALAFSLSSKSTSSLGATEPLGALFAGKIRILLLQYTVQLQLVPTTTRIGGNEGEGGEPL